MENLSFTKEETIDNLLYAIHGYNKYTKNADGESLVCNTFTCIDGGSEVPAFELNAILENETEDISGELHSLVLKSHEELEKMKKENLISPIHSDFIEAIKLLIQNFNEGKFRKSEELIFEILKLIDFGCKGIKFEMKAVSSVEDIQYHIDREENYYPIEGIDIAGNLSERYKELYLK